MEKKIDEIFKLWQEHEGAGGQLLVTYKGKTIIEKCYGYANIETKTPITPETIFHVASVSKQFTAMSILILHERGMLSVYDDVRKYIPDLIGFKEPLTIKQMMNHVSGMREHYGLFYLQGRSADDSMLQSEILRLIARQKVLNHQPGDEFIYCNANYVLLATIVERLTGMSFPEFARKNLFEPLGMDHSFFRDDPGMLIPNRCSSYHDDGYQYTNAILNLAMYGSTGLNTTCRDLTTWIKQYQNPTLISRETMENIMFDIPTLKNGTKGNYAGGVRIDEMLGHRYIHHGGVNAGFRTFGVLFPDDDLIVTVFTNTYNIPIETAGRDVARVVLGLPPRVPKNLDDYKKDTVDLDSVAGLYYCDKNGDNFRVEVRDGDVYYAGVKLTPIGGNLFKQGRLNVTFAFGEKTAVNERNNVMELRKLTETVPAEQGSAYAGEYYFDDAQSHFTVCWEDGRLWLDHLRHGRRELNWLKDDVFFYGLREITFTRDEHGEVNGYLLNQKQLRDIPFQKIK